MKSLSHFWLFAMDCNLPGFSVHGIFQARILEWVAISFSRRSSQPRDWTWVFHIVGRRFTVWATREGQCAPTSTVVFSDQVQWSAGYSQGRVWYKIGLGWLKRVQGTLWGCFQNSPCAPQMFLSWGLGREHYLFGYRVITMENKHNSGPGFQIIQMDNIWNSPFNFNQFVSGRLALTLHFSQHPSPLPWHTGGRLYFSVSWPSHMICFSLWKDAEVTECQS